MFDPRKALLPTRDERVAGFGVSKGGETNVAAPLAKGGISVPPAEHV